MRKFGYLVALAVLVALAAIVFSTVSTMADPWPVCCYNLPIGP